VTKNRLGLHSERSWIILTEANEFAWAGLDLRPVPGRDLSSIAYGVLPPGFFTYVRDKFLERDRDEKSLGASSDLSDVMALPRKRSGARFPHQLINDWRTA
jgi:hypothetical protein